MKIASHKDFYYDTSNFRNVALNIATNGHVLPMAGNSKIFLPERRPIKELKVQNMNKSSIDYFQPEQKPSNEPKADEMHVSPAVGNTNVACSAVIQSAFS